MPRLRRRARKRSNQMTPYQWMELICGPCGESRSEFGSEEERRAVWMEYAWELKSEFPDGPTLWGEDKYGVPLPGARR